MTTRISGILFYNLPSNTAPPTPTLASFSTTTKTFASISANWSMTFDEPDPSTNVSTEAGAKYWAAPYYVSDSTIVVGTVFKWRDEDALITFDNIGNAAATPFVDGGNFKTNTISLSAVKAGTTGTYNGSSIGLGSSSLSFSQLLSGGVIMTSNIANYGLASGHTGGGAAIATGTTATTDAGAAITSAGGGSNNWSSWRTEAQIASGVYGGRFVGGVGGSVSEIKTAFTGYAYYIVSGSVGPFTGSHDALQSKLESLPAVGDLMVDVQLISAPTINDSITEMTVSTQANQPGVVGVFVSESGKDFVPAALADRNAIGLDGKSVVQRLKPEFANISNSHRFVSINSIGEGKINVCGQNGDIAIGDLIVASDTAGKGMRQSDDMVREYTVAKAREAVTFASPNEIKQIACIYMCG